MKMVDKYGAEQTKFLLHSHDHRIILEEAVTSNADATAATAVAVNLARSTSNRTPSRSDSEQHGGEYGHDTLLKPHSLRSVLDAQLNAHGGDTDTLATNRPQTTESLNLARGARPTSVLRRGAHSSTPRDAGAAAGAATSAEAALALEQAQHSAYTHVTQRPLVAAAGIRVRGADMLPSVDVPNIPVLRGVQRQSSTRHFGVPRRESDNP